MDWIALIKREKGNKRNVQYVPLFLPGAQMTELIHVMTAGNGRRSR
jgi:hypothetical protein